MPDVQHIVACEADTIVINGGIAVEIEGFQRVGKIQGVRLALRGADDIKQYGRITDWYTVGFVLFCLFVAVFVAGYAMGGMR